MIIDFTSMAEQTIKSFYGGEKEINARMFSDDQNRVMCGRIAPGASIGSHTHETSSELVYILSGSARAICDGREESVLTGMCHYCPKGHSHSLINDGDEELLFFAVVPQQ